MSSHAEVENFSRFIEGLVDPIFENREEELKDLLSKKQWVYSFATEKSIKADEEAGFKHLVIDKVDGEAGKNVFLTCLIKEGDDVVIIDTRNPRQVDILRVGSENWQRSDELEPFGKILFYKPAQELSPK